MLRIGEFAWLSQVTVETLRHYDRLGLLKPADLDRFTGYRYYSLDQLPRLNRILALKDLGLPLKEIARLLDQEISAAEIRSILEDKKAELQEQIQEAENRLARVRARLEQIEMEGKMPEYEVLLKTVEAQWIASVRETISSWDQDVVGPTITRMCDGVEDHLRGHGARFAGPGIALYHEGQFVHIGNKEEDIDLEFAAPIGGPVPEGDRVKVRELPETTVAYAVHHGHFSGLPLVKQAVFSWIQDNGYHRSGPIREVYLHYASDRAANEDSPHHVTEVQFPVRKD
jgi:DNA-binding transcriptional MerR regulator/predicted transcriptional regulator YdeE